MIYIIKSFSFIELIQLSFLFQKIVQEGKELTVFCHDNDFSLVEYIYINIKGLYIKPISELNTIAKDNQTDNGNFFVTMNDTTSDISGKQALFIQHMGIGDMINLEGATNYLSETVDEIYVTCHSMYKHIAKELYSRNNKVRLLLINTPGDICYRGETRPGNEIMWTPTFRMLHQYFQKTHICGIFTPNTTIWQKDSFEKYNLPVHFYIDLGIDPSVRFTHHTIKSNEKSKELYKGLEGIDYTFVHQMASSSKLDLVNWDIQTRFTIDPDENLYKIGDPYYELAQTFVKQGIFSYIDIIQNASELYMIDSCFCCISVFIRPLSATKKHCYIRDTKKELIGWFDQC